MPGPASPERAKGEGACRWEVFRLGYCDLEVTHWGLRRGAWARQDLSMAMKAVGPAGAVFG